MKHNKQASTHAQQLVYVVYTSVAQTSFVLTPPCQIKEIELVVDYIHF